MTRAFSFDLLSDGSLILTVGESCIQATARQAHREITTALLEEPTASPKMKNLADILQRFLSTTNFTALRAEHPELAGGTRSLVRLYRYENSDDIRWAVVEPK